MRSNSFKKTCLCLAIQSGLCSAAFAQNESDELIDIIEVRGSTPLNTAVEAKALFGSKQVLSQQDIASANERSLVELLKTQFASVNLNDVQNNPFQPDLQYRGFTASPLLGLPQGISVYLNGSRVNEVFGDTVNWDLIPLDAIDTVSLYSGSNPIFGQNTLGGALALTTKTGFSYEGTELEGSIGEHGRRSVGIETGGNNGKWGYYLNVNRYEEDGWRDFSPSEVQQAFGSITHNSDTHHIDISYIFADNELLGNGAAPVELLELQGREAVFTQPDQTNNELHHISFASEFVLSDSLTLSANAFFRSSETESINGDDSDFGVCQFDDGRVTLCEFEDDDDDDDDIDSDDDDDDDVLPFVGDLEAVEFIGFDDDIALSDIIDIDPSILDGTFNTGRSKSDSYGLTAQLAKTYELAGKSSELIVGFSYQKGDISYQADTTFGILANDTIEDSRSVTPIEGLQSAEARVRLDVDTESTSLFFVHTTALTDHVSLNVAGRWNGDDIEMNDLIDSGEGSLDGDHRFTRFNPAIGLDIDVTENGLLNLAYSESSRTPSPAELSCADEDDPCRLPNGFVADPPLEQVVTKTWEANFSGSFNGIDVIFNLFRSDSEDDIIFQQAGSTASRGFFINIDETRRQGVEFSLGSHIDNLSYRINYNYLDATYESSFTSFSPFNPQGAGRIVNPGDTIPGQPEHLIKLYLDYAFSDNVLAGLEVITASSQFFRGDEANENDKIDGYTIANLVASYHINDHLSLHARINNLFDTEYETFGTYGEADEVLGNIFPQIENPEFVGPSQPRTASLSVRYKF